MWCTVQFCTVRCCTVKGTTPPHKSEIFSLHFWMNQTISNVFQKLLEKNQKNQNKSKGLKVVKEDQMAQWLKGLMVDRLNG